MAHLSRLTAPAPIRARQRTVSQARDTLTCAGQAEALTSSGLRDGPRPLRKWGVVVSLRSHCSVSGASCTEPWSVYRLTSASNGCERRRRPWTLGVAA
jgi:hypothetical protein